MLTTLTAPILAALIIVLLIGLGGFHANPSRLTSQCFLLLTVAASCWLASLYFGSTASSQWTLEFCIRQASAFGAVVLAIFDLLRLSIREQQWKWRQLLSHSLPWLVIAIVVVAFCQTRFFLEGARFPTFADLAPQAIYGKGVYLYAAYFAAALVVLMFASVRDIRVSKGRVRAELGFVLVGAMTILVLTLGLYQALKWYVDPSRLFWFAPLRVVLFCLVIAYGIATRKVMDVGLFLRRAMSYAVLATYLLALYLFVWWLVAKVGESVLHTKEHQFAHITAALVIAFALAQARGFSQSFADKLFISSRGLDFRATVGKAAAILESITTLPDLLRRFASTIGEAVGTDSVTIYLAGKKAEFSRAYPFGGSRASAPVLSADGPLVQWLSSHREPLIVDELHRVRATPAINRVRARMEELNAAAALGIFTREHLVGIMLLGPRLSGRIYGRTEQTALQVLCGQLAVAIDNAELFTEVQNARIYNEILLQNLTTGVVAADADGDITVFNQEAAQIAGLNTNGVERTVDDLPAPLRDIIQTTLTSGERQEDRDVELAGGTFARASSAIFRGQGGELLGALMVVTDITALKRLELQIRRSDRLASLGTLSAGMAHEIKNPLVSIKTFAQLLPERYQESDFRATFSSLIVHEIDRIDSLVNQLLRFARPAKPLLRPIHLHEVLEKTFQLVQHRLYQKEIKITRTLEASLDTIRADSDQMEQVFLNFFLNAMDAMKRGGELTVATEIRTGDSLVTHLLPADEERHEALCISIRDTGEGIKKEDIARVFDPFFTTKDFGTGLGLSVVHGIIEEHGGQIEVESEVAKGTVFHIFLPLVHFDQGVVAA